MAFSATTESTKIGLELGGSTFESALIIGVTLALFHSLGMIPVDITKLNMCQVSGNECK